MKVFTPKALPETSKFRTLKAAFSASLLVIPISLTGALLWWLYLIVGYSEQSKTMYVEVFEALLYVLPVGLLSSFALMLFVGIPVYLLANRFNRVSIANALATGLLATSLIPISFHFDGTSMGQHFGLILFALLLPYGITIAWTFYHLIKQPTPNQ